jgi:hypothetical protein
LAGGVVAELLRGAHVGGVRLRFGSQQGAGGAGRFGVVFSQQRAPSRFADASRERCARACEHG